MSTNSSVLISSSLVSVMISATPNAITSLKILTTVLKSDTSSSPVNISLNIASLKNSSPAKFALFSPHSATAGRIGSNIDNLIIVATTSTTSVNTLVFNTSGSM